MQTIKKAELYVWIGQKQSPSHDGDNMKEKLISPMDRALILNGQSDIIVVIFIWGGADRKQITDITTTRMNLKGITLSYSQFQKVKYYEIPLIWHSGKRQHYSESE